MKEISKQVGARLQESRKAKNMTQKEVALAFNITQQQYSRYETGQFEVDYELLIALCKLYDVSADYLLGLKEF